MNDRMRMQVTDSFEDGGKIHKRATSHDFSTVVYRTNEKIKTIIGDNKDASNLMNEGCYYYEIGNYSDALKNFSWCLEKYPALNEQLFYYIRICKKVLEAPLLQEEKVYAAKLERYRNSPKWKRWLYKKPEFRVRCKWCGRYTKYVHPNKPTFGCSLSTFGENNCGKCGRMYPLPSWDWDSPDGRAYSYYRMSFGEDTDFYNEFEKDYEPIPKNAHGQS